MDDEEKRKKGAFKEWLTAQGLRWDGGDNGIEEVIEYNLPDDELKRFNLILQEVSRLFRR